MEQKLEEILAILQGIHQLLVEVVAKEHDSYGFDKTIDGGNFDDIII